MSAKNDIKDTIEPSSGRAKGLKNKTGKSNSNTIQSPIPPPAPSPPPIPADDGQKNEDDEIINTWECSVCTYRNSAEAFKCLMCDVRKGTSTRKPRINPQLVAQQVARQQQQIQQQALKATAKLAEKEAKKAETTKISSPNSSISGEKRKSSDVPEPVTPGPSAAKTPKKDKKEKEDTKEEIEPVKATPIVNNNFRPQKLKNIDRKNSSTKAITVNNVTVIITEFQPKKSNSSLLSQSAPTPSTTVATSGTTKSSTPSKALKLMSPKSTSPKTASPKTLSPKIMSPKLTSPKTSSAQSKSNTSNSSSPHKSNRDAKDHHNHNDSGTNSANESKSGQNSNKDKD